jgi:hypothetical protein
MHFYKRDAMRVALRVRFNWIGRIASGVETVITSQTSQVRTVSNAKQREVLVGATGPVAGSSIYPAILNNISGTHFKVIRATAGRMK